MTCRHNPGDPNCSSHPANVAARERETAAYVKKTSDAAHERQLQELRAQIPPSPDAQNYVIEDVEQVGHHVALRVRYPNCSRCAYEGLKVMVFMNVNLKDVVKWRRIDPHFRDPQTADPTHAPTPAARFPGNDDGWQDALTYLREKVAPAVQRR